MKNKIIETVNKMSDAEIAKLYEYLFGAGATQDAKIDADHKMLEKKFGIKTMQDFAQMCIGTVIGIDTLADFVKYRNEIKKPLKTARPLKAYAQELIKISNAGLDARSAIEIMKQHEWQTLNIEWIRKKMPQQATNADLAQFGFKPQHTQELLK
jgi:hypothetical protein